MPSGDSTLYTDQHRYDDLPALTDSDVHARRETIFLMFSGLFLGTLAMLNILGITRFLELFRYDFDGDPTTPATVFAVAVGVLPYPVTFLCTDFISELFGRHRANRVVLVGLVLNAWVVGILWLGGLMPGLEATDAAGNIIPDTVVTLNDAGEIEGVVRERPPVFFEVRALAFGAVAASMIAYMVAQLVDVQLFHFWRRLTNGKHLWLRNNGSTLVSQLIDSTAVILITYYGAKALTLQDGTPVAQQLAVLIATGYAFKLVAALVDTLPFMWAVPRLARYLRLPPPDEP